MVSPHDGYLTRAPRKLAIAPTHLQSEGEDLSRPKKMAHGLLIAAANHWSSADFLEYRSHNVGSSKAQDLVERVAAHRLRAIGLIEEAKDLLVLGP